MISNQSQYDDMWKKNNDYRKILNEVIKIVYSYNYPEDKEDLLLNLLNDLREEFDNE